MKLIFLGTRGNIEVKSRRHRMHTCMLASYRRQKVLIDCGETWLGKLEAISPHAVVITHAHPDHVGGLTHGLDRPVYATAAAWRRMEALDLPQRHTIRPRKPCVIGGITFEAFKVEHSITRRRWATEFLSARRRFSTRRTLSISDSGGRRWPA